MRPVRRRVPEWASKVTTVAIGLPVALLISACAPPADPGDAPVAAPDCDWLKDNPAGSGPSITIVGDLTADAAVFGLPGPVRESLSRAALADGSVSVLGVNGADARPTTVLVQAGLAIEGAGTARAGRLAALVPDCVELAVMQARPTTPGSDYLAALQEAAALAQGGELVVLGNGLSNS